ncbi:Histidine kinase [Candidatus Hydrogenisulfobacillus filiaventi]|uniref:Oxygen sensor histidine kinase NreB n=1 Tax=Candidatus Hydrogenisulfobacillus filiaventi TaxID=2707344 RepID=A0A6F8ZGA9_9FIRM|nr:GAF domain-containing sensor histidine kinase [Bacillota bacterium]CAB1128788.1 Histidine kinase [Candidatus Hydrogenisulfobacillus filiaventi]
MSIEGANARKGDSDSRQTAGSAPPSAVGGLAPAEAESSLNRLARTRRWVAGVSLVLLPLIILAAHTLWPTALASTQGAATVASILALLGSGYTLLMFRLIDRQQRTLEESHECIRAQRDRLDALREATYTLSTIFDLDAVLQAVVDTARGLIGARYAALGIVDRAALESGDPDAPLLKSIYISGLTPEEQERIGSLPEGKGILGLVIREARTIRLDRLQDHPASVGFPPNHPPMESFLGVPMVYRDRVVGNLYLTEKAGGFTLEDQQTAELFARQAAVMVAHAELSAQVKEAGMLSERNRIAMELHDGVLQSLYGIRLNLENLLDTEPMAPAVERGVTVAIDTLSQCMSEIRFFIQDLKGARIDFADAIQDLVRRLNPMNRPVRVVAPRHPRPPGELPVPFTRTVLLHIQEALSNALHYAEAADIRVSWYWTARCLTVSVADNGRGFDPDAPRDPTHQGLTNMRDRARALGGQVVIASRPGKGTLVRIRVPLPSASLTVGPLPGPEA